MSRDKLIKFLQKGFFQIDKTIIINQAEQVVDKLNGIVGWLTMFRRFISKGYKHDKAIDAVLNQGSLLVKKEFEAFLSNRFQAKKDIHTS